MEIEIAELKGEVKGLRSDVKELTALVRGYSTRLHDLEMAEATRRGREEAEIADAKKRGDESSLVPKETINWQKIVVMTLSITLGVVTALGALVNYTIGK